MTINIDGYITKDDNSEITEQEAEDIMFGIFGVLNENDFGFSGGYQLMTEQEAIDYENSLMSSDEEE